MAAQSQAAREFDVFHQGLVRKPADIVEQPASNKDSLVASGDARPAGAAVHERGDHRQHAGAALDVHVEAAPGGARGQRAGDGGRRVRGQRGVHVQEQQHLVPSCRGARVHLPRPARRRAQHGVRQTGAAGAGAVGAATVADDELVAVAAQRRQRQ